MVATLRPRLTVDFGPAEGPVAALVEQALTEWDGTLRSVAPAARPPAHRRSGKGAARDGDGRSADAAVRACSGADLALVHGDGNWWAVTQALNLLAAAVQATGGTLPVILVAGTDPPWGRRDRYRDPEGVPPQARQPLQREGDRWVALDSATPRNGVLTAVEDFAGAHPALRLLLVPGLGGTAILSEDARLAAAGGGLPALLDDLRFPPRAAAQIAVVDARRRIERERAAEAASGAALAARLIAEQEAWAAERHELSAKIGELTDRLAGARARALTAEVRAELCAEAPAVSDPRTRHRPGLVTGTPIEPSRSSVTALLRPGDMLAALGWPGPERELGLPVPVDQRGVVQAGAARRVAVESSADGLAVRRTVCSVLDRAGEPVTLSLSLGAEPDAEMRALAARVVAAVPAIGLDADGRRDADLVLAPGAELPWNWPLPRAAADVPSVAYLLPGLPREGSGGSHSIVAEARGLRALGAEARICVPAAALDDAVGLYGNDDDLFRPYSDPDGIAEATGAIDVAVATEHPSVPLLERLVAIRPQIVAAYYVQDYEPLFGDSGSGRSDRALLSYRAIPGQLLFAKSEWLRNVVTARHRVAVAKVEASLNGDLFHDHGRQDDAERPVRVVAMVRPRTPRRRPEATLRALALIDRAAGDAVQTLAFGCDHESFTSLAAAVGARPLHLGVLSQGEVGELLRRCDVFLDGSAYQAFGRTGLEAMACGAVPVLPGLGGAVEYATHGGNALLIDDDRPESLAAAVVSLVRDPARRERMRVAGIAAARRYSVASAAASQLDLFSAATARRRAPEYLA